MKKAEMVNTVVNSAAAMWKVMRMDEQTFGKDSDIANRSRAQWCVLYELVEQLGLNDQYHKSI